MISSVSIYMYFHKNQANKIQVYTSMSSKNENNTLKLEKKKYYKCSIIFIKYFFRIFKTVNQLKLIHYDQKSYH